MDEGEKSEVRVVHPSQEHGQGCRLGGLFVSAWRLMVSSKSLSMKRTRPNNALVGSNAA